MKAQSQLVCDVFAASSYLVYTVCCKLSPVILKQRKKTIKLTHTKTGKSWRKALSQQEVAARERVEHAIGLMSKTLLHMHNIFNVRHFEAKDVPKVFN